MQPGALMRFQCRLIVTPRPFLPEIAPFHTIIPPNDFIACAIKNAKIIETDLTAHEQLQKAVHSANFKATQNVVYEIFIYILGKLMHGADNNATDTKMMIHINSLYV